MNDNDQLTDGSTATMSAAMRKLGVAPIPPRPDDDDPIGQQFYDHVASQPDGFATLDRGTDNDKVRRDIPDADDDSQEQYRALKSIAEEINLDRAYSDEPECVSDSADVNDVLAKLVAAATARRR